MNLREIRTAIFSSIDWAPDPTEEAVTRVDGFIARALQQMSLEAPFLFFDDIQRFGTQPEAASADDDDTIQMLEADAIEPTEPPNSWVFYTTKMTNDPTATPWMIDRSWDGRKIIIIDDDGVEHKNQIRAVWAMPPPAEGGEAYFVNLVHPWPWQTYGTGPFKWRVFDDVYWFPDDMIELKALRIVGQNYPSPILMIGQEEAERVGIVDDATSNDSGGPMTMGYRREHYSLPGPNVAPDLAQAVIEEQDPNADLYWKGPDPPGEFQYCFTYTWGKRDIDYQNAGIGTWDSGGQNYEETYGGVETPPNRWGQNRMREPLFESAPSPAAGITMELAGTDPDGWGHVRVILPNIQYMLGTGLIGFTSPSGPILDFTRINTSHGGLQIRVYRRRVTADFDVLGTGAYNPGMINVGGQYITGLQKLDIHDDFYLLAEMRPDHINESTFIDDGTILPDYTRPLRDVHGYQSVRFSPMPDARYEVEFRCVRRPKRLVSPQDVPPIHAEACELVISYAKALTYEMMKDYQSAQGSMGMYRDQLATLRKRYGDLRPSNVPVKKHFASPAGYGRSINTRWWKRSTVP